jgi:hypothetical protein
MVISFVIQVQVIFLELSGSLREYIPTLVSIILCLQFYQLNKGLLREVYGHTPS